MVRDVTERRDNEANLAAQAAMFRSAFDHAGVGKALVALDGQFLNINAAFCELLGYAEAEMLKLDFQTITHPDDLAKDLDLLGQLTRGEIPSYRLEKRYLRADGSIVWALLTVSMVRDEMNAPSLYIAQVQDRTQQRTAEAALQSSEARYRLLAENATDVIATFGTDTRFTYLSPSIEALLGYTPEELIGQPTSAVMHPGDYETSLQVYRQHLAGPSAHEPFHFEYRAVRKTGEIVWLAGHPRPVFEPGTRRLTGFQDVLRDVSARRAAEQALAKSESRFRMLAENASDLIMETGLDGRVAYVSPSSVNLTGYAPHEVEGKPALRWVHPNDQAAVISAFQAQVKGCGSAPSRAIEYRLIASDGREIWMESSPCATLDPATGAVLSVTDVARDVTARRAWEAELTEARDAAEEAARVKADFMSNMSHEIRTPLTAILGFTSLLGAHADLSNDAQYQVERIGSAGQALLAIVNDVLDFSKLESGLMPIKPRPSAVRETIADSLALFGPQAAAKGISLGFEADALPHANIDPDRLGQVLLNLVGNAVKFTDEGLVTVHASYEADRERLCVDVSDSGPGMDSEQQAKLFHRFSQVDASSTRRHGGTGLGLAICRGLVEAMGGEIGVTSEVGRGSRFWFNISAPAAEVVGEEGARVTTSLTGIRLLVADDNPVNRELVRALLSPLGAEVTEVADGVEAVDVALAKPFDVILLDVRMPRLNGPDAALRIRNQPGPNETTPILAFTADYDLERFGEQAGRGFDGVVRKPISSAELVTEIARCTAFEVTQWVSGDASGS